MIFIYPNPVTGLPSRFYRLYALLIDVKCLGRFLFVGYPLRLRDSTGGLSNGPVVAESGDEEERSIQLV